MSQSGILKVADSILPDDVPTSFLTNFGTAVPIGNQLEILGAAGTVTSAVGNVITVTVSGSGMTWNRITASQTLVINNGYFCVGGGDLVLLLPAVSTLGDTIEVYLDGSTSFQITQNAGQSIKLGNQVTTSGVGGSITTTQQGDSLRLVCDTINLRWTITSMMGNTTFV